MAENLDRDTHKGISEVTISEVPKFWVPLDEIAWDLKICPEKIQMTPNLVKLDNLESSTGKLEKIRKENPEN